MGGLLIFVLLAGAALAAAPVAAAQPGYCRSHVIVAEQLPERVDLSTCDIVGSLVTAGELMLRVPGPGQGRSIRAMTTGGETGLDVRTTLDGYVEVRVESDQATVAAPANDAIAQAEPITDATGHEWSRTASTADATRETIDDEADAGCGVTTAHDHTVWYRFTSLREGDVVLSATSPDPANPIRVDVFGYDDSFEPVAIWPQACTDGPLYVVEDSAYYVRVSSAAPTTFTLNWRLPRPIADNFSQAALIAPGGYSEISHMLYATREAGEPQAPCQSASDGTIWHRIQQGTLRRLTINASGAPVAIYRGTSLSALTRIACVAEAWGQYVVLPSTGAYYVQQTRNPYDERGQLYVDSGEPYPQSPPPCDESSRLLLGGRRAKLAWRFNPGKIPDSLGGPTGTQALRATKQGMSVITGSKNDCGLADAVSATHEYQGTTSRTATLCTRNVRDSVNTVDFGVAVVPGSLGLACSATRQTSTGAWRIIETDLRMTRGAAWTLAPDAPACSNRYDFVGVVAHEAGHAFGLDHPYHGSNQTMSPASTSCNGGFRTLGRGDVRALRTLY